VAITTELEDLGTTDGAFVVKEIAATIAEKSMIAPAMKSIRPALAKLLLWFRENASRAKKLFPMLYDQKHLLYDDDQILDNIERAEELSELLSEYNVKNVAELRAVIEKHAASSQLLPVRSRSSPASGLLGGRSGPKALEDKNWRLFLARVHGHARDVPPGAIADRRRRKRVVDHLLTLEEIRPERDGRDGAHGPGRGQKDGREVTIV